MEKVKAHREPEEAAGEEDLWDKDAKQALHKDLASYGTSGQDTKKQVQHKIHVAYLCSLMLQDITKHAESSRKERDKQETTKEPEPSLPLVARGVSSNRFSRVLISLNPTPMCAKPLVLST